jgi:hypothetical protein
MRGLRRRGSDKHRATREARVVGGPNNGLLVTVTERDGDFAYPDVMDFSEYSFDHEAWEFQYTPGRR